MRSFAFAPRRGRLAVLVSATAALVLLAASSQAPATPSPKASQNADYNLPLPYLTPIPIVRLAGRTTRTGARVTLVRVKAPRRSSVTLRCAGGRRKGCPFRSKTKQAPRSGAVRFREVERRLRAGVRLGIFVRRGDTIGKYTRFSIRKRKAPARFDACLFPGDPFDPRGCP
jgi:hypothetical protein